MFKGGKKLERTCSEPNPQLQRVFPGRQGAAVLRESGRISLSRTPITPGEAPSREGPGEGGVKTGNQAGGAVQDREGEEGTRGNLCEAPLSGVQK